VTVNRSKYAVVGLLLLVACARPLADGALPGKDGGREDRPFVAVWRHTDGFVSKADAPYLRVAVWDDGRILFAADPKKWGHDLRRGRVANDRVARLKAALRETGVFDLKGHCYLGPDMPIDCMMADLGDRKQALYWVEGMTEWMDKPHKKAFVRCWTAVNDLALATRPAESEPAGERFGPVPKSWYLKRMIQSE
jgi:hypothetical protein